MSWFHPRVVDVTKTTTSQVLPTDLAQIHAGVQEPSLLAAKRYVANLQSEYVSVQNAKRADDQLVLHDHDNDPGYGADDNNDNGRHDDHADDGAMRGRR